MTDPLADVPLEVLMEAWRALAKRQVEAGQDRGAARAADQGQWERHGDAVIDGTQELAEEPTPIPMPAATPDVEAVVLDLGQEDD